MATIPIHPPSAIIVSIVGDAPLVRHGLRSMLVPYRHLVHLRADSLVNFPRDPADISLYDPTRDGTGPSQMERLVADPARGLVVMYSFAPPPWMVADMLDRGCAAFLDKRVPAADMMDSLRSLVSDQGQVHARPSPRASWPGKEHRLSRRESEVIGMIARGLTNEDISVEVHLSINTVKSYIRSAYRKLGLTTRPQAVRWGIEHGLAAVGPQRLARPLGDQAPPGMACAGRPAALTTL